MNTAIWIVYGGLIGWVATILTGQDARFGVIGNIVIGIVGSYIGGYISTRIIKGPIVSGFDFREFLMAVFGSIILLFVLNLLF